MIGKRGVCVENSVPDMEKPDNITVACARFREPPETRLQEILPLKQLDFVQKTKLARATEYCATPVSSIGVNIVVSKIIVLEDRPR